MRSIFLFLLLSLLLFSSCNSYLSIEKRKYRDGFYVSHNTRNAQPHKIRDIQEVDGFDIIIISSNSFAGDPIENNTSELELIPHKKTTMQHSGYLLKNKYLQDTIPKKEKHKRQRDGFMKFDERKDLTKTDKETYLFAIVGLVLGILSFAILFWTFFMTTSVLLLMLGILGALTSAFIGFALSIHSASYIKRHSDKYEGWILARYGIILNLTFLSLISIYILALFFF